jgi:methionine-gamma-lyase
MENKPSQRMRDVQFFGEEGGVVPSIDVSATSTFLNPADMEKAFRGEIAGCYLYSRHSNPTVKAFSKKMAAMENTEAALGLASGMSAIYAAIRQLMPEGGHIVSSRTVYGGTYALFQNILPKIGIKVTWVNTSDLKAVEKAVTKDTKILYAETMSNPLLAVADLPRLSEISRKHKLTFVVDNTFTPLIVTPARLGVDVVLHSCTKFISGASDLMAGSICARQEFIDQLIDVNNGIVMLTGPVMDANVAHRLYERLDHLASRIVSHSKSAMFLAKEMAHAKIPVIYPGLETHPDFKLLNDMMNKQFGFGGMMTVECGSPEKALELAHELQQAKFGLYAVSLGFSRTLMSCPSLSTSSEIPEDEQKKMGLSKGLLRLSIGYSGDDETMAEKFMHCYSKVTAQ